MTLDVMILKNSIYLFIYNHISNSIPTIAAMIHGQYWFFLKDPIQN